MRKREEGRRVVRCGAVCGAVRWCGRTVAVSQCEVARWRWQWQPFRAAHLSVSQMFFKLFTAVLLLLPAAVLMVPESARVPVYVSYGDKGFNFPDLLAASQIELDQITGAYQLKWGEGLAEDYTLQLQLSGEDTMYMNEAKTQAYLMYSMAAVHANDLPFYVAQAVSQMAGE